MPSTLAPPRIAFLGLGIMGSRMAANLAQTGLELTVWNRTRSTAEVWANKHQSSLSESPAAAANNSDILISMVADDDCVKEVFCGDQGVTQTKNTNLLCIDMSTISPTTVRTVANQLAKQNIRFIDAPVTGSAPKAADGTLTIMAGGEIEDIQQAEPVFQAMGERTVHVGPLGNGQLVKLINNAVAAANATTVAEALVFADIAGLNPNQVCEVMSHGSGGSKMLELKGAAMCEHNYEPLFKLDHMLKDVRLCLQEAQQAGAPLVNASYARSVLAVAAKRGYGQQDFAALIETIEGFANHKVGER